MKSRDFWKKNSVFFFGIMIFVLICSITVAYSSLNTTLYISGKAAYRAVEIIRITNIKLLEIEYQGHENAEINYSKEDIILNVNLPNLSSTVTYEVTITNLGNVDMVIQGIDHLNYSNEEIEYQLIGTDVGAIIPKTGKLTFKIKIKYSPNQVSLPDNTTLQAKLNFNFERRYSVLGTYYYTNLPQTYNVLNSGWYFLEAWGAQGGGNNPDPNEQTPGIAGLGGYTSGYVFLNAGDVLHIYVGGAGSKAVYNPENIYVFDANPLNGNIGYNGAGWNGGGGALCSAASKCGHGGGGATDIRINGRSLFDRIIVAGGGGGANYYISGSMASSYLLGFGGDGGDLLGDAGGPNSRDPIAEIIAEPQPAVKRQGGQISGFDFGNGQTIVPVEGVTSKTDPTIKTFLMGNGGGGGGYWGGSTQISAKALDSDFPDYRDYYGGGGGSSYISGAAGVNSYYSENLLSPDYITLHKSGYYFLMTTLEKGVRHGDGMAQISHVGIPPERKDERYNNVRYIKFCMGSGLDSYNRKSAAEFQAIVEGNNILLNKTNITSTSYLSSNSKQLLVDGKTSVTGLDTTTANTACLTFDLEGIYNLDEFAYWALSTGTYNSHSLEFSADNSNWILVSDGSLTLKKTGVKFTPWK